MLSSTISHFLEDKISVITGKTTRLLNITQVHGGDINETFRVNTNAEDFILKLNHHIGFPDFFHAEADGLMELSGKSELIIPKPLLHGSIEGSQCLLMEFLPKGNIAGNFWENFGRNLAVLHKNSSTQFGWKENNYIGTIPQQNNPQNSWNQFYAESRILFMLRAASSQVSHYAVLLSMAEKLCVRLQNLIPEE